MVIHFPQLTFLEDYVLNPRWLTHGVYTIMYAGQAELTVQSAIEILHDKKIIDEQGNVLDYPKDKCRFILDAMQEFKLVYLLREENQTFIIPELLPSDRPDTLNFDKQAGLAFEFDFKGFLPRHIMPQLTVSRHEDIFEKMVWKNGVLLQSTRFQAQALVEVSYHDRSLSIWVTGKDAKEYLAILNDEVLKILNRLDLNYKEWIKLPLLAQLKSNDNDLPGSHTVETASYRQLLAYAKKGEKVYIAESGTSYDLVKILDLTIGTQALKNVEIYLGQFFNEDNRVNKNNISIGDNSHIGSVVIAESIQDSFNALKESKANDKTQKLLTELLIEIKTLNAKVPESQEMKDISEGAEMLIKESQRESPRPPWYKANIESIQAAGKTLGVVADPIIKITKALGFIVA